MTVSKQIRQIKCYRRYFQKIVLFYERNLLDNWKMYVHHVTFDERRGFAQMWKKYDDFNSIWSDANSTPALI